MELQQCKKRWGLTQSFLLKVYIFYFTIRMSSVNIRILSLQMNSITMWAPAPFTVFYGLHGFPLGFEFPKRSAYTFETRQVRS